MRPRMWRVLGLALWLVASNTPAFSQPQTAFVTYRVGNFEVYVTDLDGRSPRNLTRHPADDTHPTWSPDGRFLAFISTRSGHSKVTRHPTGGRIAAWNDPAFATGYAVTALAKHFVLWAFFKGRGNPFSLVNGKADHVPSYLWVGN